MVFLWFSYGFPMENPIINHGNGADDSTEVPMAEAFKGKSVALYFAGEWSLDLDLDLGEWDGQTVSVH